MSSGSSFTHSTSESRPLLEDSQTTYDSIRDRDSVSYDSSEDDYPTPPPSAVSRADLVWILAGLWSAVFLGALDGNTSPSFCNSL